MKLPGFGGAPSMPAPPPPPPQRDDPAIVEAKNKLRLAELQRRGRAASILTSGQGVLGETAVDRPEARAAGLLGG